MNHYKSISLLFSLCLTTVISFANDNCTRLPHDVVLEIPNVAHNPRNSEGSIVQLKSGQLLHVYTHYFGTRGHDHDAAQLASRVSNDNGKTWSNQSVVVLENEGKLNVMSVSLLRLQNGELAMFYLVKDSPADCRPYLRFSKDEGKTWGPRTVCISEPGYNVVNNDRIIQLANGRILIPVALHAYGKKGPYDYTYNATVFCMISDDNGRSWRKSGCVTNPGVVFQEPGLVQLADGSVLMCIRTDAKYQYYSRSTDNGQTWTAAVPSPLDSPLSPAQMKRIPKSDHLLAVWNPWGQGRERSGFDIALLSPDGNRILSRHYLENKTVKTGNFQYPNIFFVNDRDFVVSYFSFGLNRPESFGGTRIIRSSIDSLCKRTVLFDSLNLCSLNDPRLAAWPETVKQGLKWLKENDLAKLPLGKTDIDADRVFVNVHEYTTRPTSKAVFEAHKDYIDIQLIFSGSELMGTVRRSSATRATDPYSAKDDVEFFPTSIMPKINDQPGTKPGDTLFKARAGDFALFGTDDIHTSGLYLDKPEKVRKIVVKCKVK